MEQHPVPQHIASFEFKLFGNLTARQFITLVFPLSLAAIIFFSLIPVLIRIPLALAVGIIGLFIALVPIDGRPFDKWVMAFIRAISRPTLRIWIKEKRMPEFLGIVVTPPQKELKIPQEITEKGRERMMAYLRSLPKENVTSLDIKEQLALDRLGFSPSEFGRGDLPPAILWPATTEPGKYVALGQGESGYLLGSLPQVAGPLEGTAQSQTAPIFEPEARPKPEHRIMTEPISSLTRAKIHPHAKPYTVSGLEKRLGSKKQEIIDLVRPTSHLASETNYSLDNIIPVKISESQVRLVHGIGSTRVRKLHFAPPVNFDLSKLPIRGERKFDISDELKKRFHFEDIAPEVVLPSREKKSHTAPKLVHEKPTPRPIPQEARNQHQKAPNAHLAPKHDEQPRVKPQEYSSFSISDKVNKESKNTIQNAAIIPLTNTPNVLSGLVTDKDGIPIESAVLVVRDENGIPVRALKTNKLGQFLSATPLASGTYTIEAESDRAKFAPVTISLKGQALPPIGIKGERIN